MKKVQAKIKAPSPARYASMGRLYGRGGSRISGKGVRIYKGMGVCFADFISFS